MARNEIHIEADYQRIKILDDDGMFYMLAAMVILMSSDYQSATKFLATHKASKSKKYLSAEKTKREIEEFTQSQLYHSIFEMKQDKFLDMLLSYEPEPC